ncbi:MAG TPA: hypothetical protein VLF39_03065 [Candidatus Saccharimonadales bacterium]|nr:hypothetical protein [Candidatus Saccharimonadales bacterium]
MPATPVLAADTTGTNTNTGTVDTTSTQAANTGQADVLPADPTPPPAPTTTDTTTTTPPPTDNSPAVDTTTTPPSTDTTVAPDTTTGPSTPPSTDTTTNPPAPDTPVCPVVAPLVQGNPSADSQSSTTVNNCLNSGAGSGNASVVGSTGGGNATSGNADVQATLLNMLNTLTNLGSGGGQLATFVKNVYGDQNGDLHIDPAALASIVAAQAKACGCGPISSSSTSQINNYLNLSALTGDASVTDGWKGGNATTGDASAIANLINIINSMANAGHSFLGTINIYGNLNGNILLPAGWVDSLLKASGAPPGPGNGGSANIDTNASVNNNINASAITGNATVQDNKHGGNATTGDALTNLNIINLINRNIVGGNVLLVFVNVLGHWYGVLMNAPAGQNTAVLGGGITQDSGCGCMLNGDYSTTSQINNNINLSAQSGNALVSGNHRGGNATSGDATTSLNLVNIINSQISAANWFGVLFINVFGTWTGNLAEETAKVTPTTGGHHTTPPPLISFTHHHNHVNYSGVTNGNSDPSSSDDSSNFDNSVLGATTNTGGPVNPHGNPWMGRLAIGGLAAFVCFTILGLADRHKKSKAAHTVPTEIVFPSI